MDDDCECFIFDPQMYCYLIISIIEIYALIYCFDSMQIATMQSEYIITISIVLSQTFNFIVYMVFLKPIEEPAPAEIYPEQQVRNYERAAEQYNADRFHNV